jgi:aspartyl-tRNA(Asn)/glutamyl-tRNA(Gln) amidotransferase subunit A
MTDTELNKLTLMDAAQMIAQRKISARELADAVISRIDHLNPDFRAFITVIDPANSDDPGSANAKAYSLNETGLLAGVPISVKDLYDTKGIRTTAGSRVFAERMPREDATVVTKLKDAGAVIVGKNNLHEFAFGVTTVNPHYGIARNPWDRERISGGSSGGSASAVALGMGFGSMGSDTGGSIRIPASLCGIVGLKPTYGRVSLRGIVPLSWSLDHAGPMTRTVQDTAVLMNVIAGYDSRDPYSRNVDILRYTDALMGGIKGVRVGIPDKFFYEHLASSVETAIHAAIRSLEKLGVQIF